MGRGLDYESMDNGYDRLLARETELGLPETPDEASFRESPTGKTVVSGEELSNIWIKDWIKSRNFSPGVRGFYLDGKSGEAEFAKLFVRSRSDWPAVDIRKYEGTGTGLFVRSNAGSAIEVEQLSDTVALRITSTSLSAGQGSVIDVINRAGTGAGIGIQQRGTGVVAYLERENPESGETAFYPILLMSGGDYANLVKTWVSDGTDPDGDLSGAIGDFCHSKKGRIHVCGGGNTWFSVPTYKAPTNDSSAVTNTTDETTVYTYWIPTSSLSDGNLMRVRAHCKFSSPAGESVTLRWKIDGTTYCSDVVSPTDAVTDGALDTEFVVSVETAGASGEAYMQMGGSAELYDFPLNDMWDDGTTVDLSGSKSVTLTAELSAADPAFTLTRRVGYGSIT